MFFFKDLWSSLANSSHFILPNGFSSLLWLNLIVALCVNSKWAYTDFVLCMQIFREHQSAMLPAILQKSRFTPKNIEGAFAMKFLNSLGLVAQWGHTVKRKLSMRNFVCPLQTYLLPVRCLPQATKGVSVIWCTSLPYCWRAAVVVWGVSLLNILICSTQQVREISKTAEATPCGPQRCPLSTCSVHRRTAKIHSTHDQTRTLFSSASKTELAS